MQETVVASCELRVGGANDHNHNHDHINLVPDHLILTGT